MNISRIAARTAVAGITTALAASAMVGVTTGSANAATAAGDYTCAAPGFFPETTFPMTVDVPLLPPSAPAGFPITPGLLSFTSTLTIPAAVAAGLGTAGVDGGRADDYTIAFGAKGVVDAPIVFDESTPQEDGSVVFSGSGANAAFTTPAAGTYSVDLPTEFTLTPTSGGSPLPVTVTCTTTDPASLGSVTTTKQVTTAKATAPKPVKKSAKAKVPVKVTNEYSADGGAPANGKVTAKEGKKVLGTATVKNGKATITLSKLKPGSHKVVVSFKGDGYNANAVAKAITVKVKK
jgi:hypothetical protein